MIKNIFRTLDVSTRAQPELFQHHGDDSRRGDQADGDAVFITFRDAGAGNVVSVLLVLIPDPELDLEAGGAVGIGSV